MAWNKASRFSGNIFFAAERPKEGVWSEPTSVELGVVSHVELVYNEAKLKTLEEAKPIQLQLGTKEDL